MTAVTPADLTITPRDLKIDREARNARWWHGGDPIATAYFNALSAAFPQGETFFIESVRRYPRLGPIERAAANRSLHSSSRNRCTPASTSSSIS